MRWQTARMRPAERLPTPRLLVLWDVDHTLIESRGVGRALYERAFPAATGTPLTALASLAGRTELDIMADTLRLNGVEPTSSALAALAKALVQEYEHARDLLRSTGRALPGAHLVLTDLAADPAVHQTVLTGNLREVARIKLDVFDLARHLDLSSGAYGDDHPDRATLVGLAQQRAHHSTGVPFTAEATVLIGDTPRDVHAGLTAGVHVIAVATGTTSPTELRAAGAHHVAATLTECHTLLKHTLTTPENGSADAHRITGQPNPTE